MDRITDFSETIAELGVSVDDDSPYFAERDLLDFINSLKLDTVRHNGLIQAIDRYRNICEKVIQYSAALD